jgi:hypothetical protein
MNCEEMDCGEIRDAAASRYNAFMYKIQGNAQKHSEDLAQRIAKARKERKVKLKKRRTIREKMEKIMKELHASELDVAQADAQIKGYEADYQIVLMEEAKEDG